MEGGAKRKGESDGGRKGGGGSEEGRDGEGVEGKGMRRPRGGEEGGVDGSGRTRNEVARKASGQSRLGQEREVDGTGREPREGRHGSRGGRGATVSAHLAGPMSIVALLQVSPPARHKPDPPSNPLFHADGEAGDCVGEEGRGKRGGGRGGGVWLLGYSTLYHFEISHAPSVEVAMAWLCSRDGSEPGK